MRPLVPITVAFMLGLVCARWWEPDYATVGALIVFSIFLAIIGAVRKWRDALSHTLPIFFFLGMLFLLPLVHPEFSENHIKTIIEDRAPRAMRMQGVVVDGPERRGDSAKLLVEVTSYMDGGKSTPVNGRVLLTAGLYSGAGSGSNPGLKPTNIKRGDLVGFTSRLKLPKNFGNPGGFDYEWWLAGRGVYVRGYVRRGSLVKIATGKAGVLTFTDEVRARVSRLIESSNAENKEILKALIIGEKGGIAPDVRTAFVRSGTAHILAISGLHMGFFAYLSYFTFFWCLRRSRQLMLAFDVKKIALAMSVLPVILYGFVSGPSLATQRAMVMVIAVILTFLLGRTREILNTLALAALLILCLSPGALWTPSFQLSFVAVLAIVCLVPGFKALGENAETGTMDGWQGTVYKLYTKTKKLFFISVAAGLGTWPALAWHFNSISVAGFAANLIVVPLTGFIAVPLGILSVVVLPVSERLSLLLLALADQSVTIVVMAAGVFSSLPLAYARVATPTLLELAIFYCGLLLLPFLFKARRLDSRSRRRVIAGIAVLFIIFAAGKAWWYLDQTSNGNLTVTFISVGQGDAALVEFGPRDNAGDGGKVKRMLIDGGGMYGGKGPGRFDTGEMVVAPLLWKKKIKNIDYLVLTHAQRDHQGGLEFVVNNFSPGEFWWGGGPGLDQRLVKALKKGGVRMVRVNSQTEKLNINGAVVEFLHPPPINDNAAGAAAAGLDLNDSSVVIKIKYGNRSFLFTGDVEERGEQALLKKDIKSDVLKVPHHGSKSSSSDAFVESVKPEVAVASVGWANHFGFPHSEVIDRYELSGARFLRTDINGAVTVTTDGQDLHVTTHLTR